MNQPSWEEERRATENREGSQYICEPHNIHLTNCRLSDHLSQRLSLEDESESGSGSGSEEKHEMTFFKESSVSMEDVGEFASGQEDDENYSEELEDSDLEEDRSAGGRYFGGGGSGGPKCFNCGQPGHIVKDCPEGTSLPCYLCGGRDHQRINCPEEICYNCNRVGHVSRDCTLPRKRRMFENDLCNRCNMPGHLQKDCSLLWRRYVFSREVTRQEVARASNLLSPYCYNCADSSHFGDECSNRKRPEYSIFHYPILDFLQNAAYCPSEGRPRSSPHRRDEQRKEAHPKYDRDDRCEKGQYQHSVRQGYGHDDRQSYRREERPQGSSRGNRHGSRSLSYRRDPQ